MDAQRHGVVVGYDGSAGSTIALDWAADMARRRGETLTVLHCAEQAPVSVAPAYISVPAASTPEETSQGLLDEAVERATMLLGEGRVTATNIFGSAAASLVEASEGATMVVTGCRGRSRFTAGILGSVSYAVTAHARCPAVVVRGDRPTMPDEGHKVVVGIDDSASSEPALQLAAEVAEAAGAGLQIVRVGTMHSPEAWAYAETSSAGTERTHVIRESVEQTVAHAAETVRSARPGLTVETEVLFGHPGHVVAQLGEHAGLIVVGSRGRGGFTGLLLGSVSHTVIHEAACPVMVVHA